MKKLLIIAISVSLHTSTVFAADGPIKTVTITNNEIVVMDDSGTRQLTHDGLGKDFAVWSQDGAKIAFIRQINPDVAFTNLVVMDTKGTILKDIHVRPDGGNPPNGMRYVESLQWVSPSTLALSGSVNPSTDETAVLDLGSGKELRDDFDDNLGSSYSPDGRHVAYVSGLPHFSPRSSAEPALSVDDSRVFPASGGQVTFVSNQSWSNDSSRVAAVADDLSSNRRSIVVWDTNKKALTLIPADVTVSQPELDTIWYQNVLYIFSKTAAWSLAPNAKTLIAITDPTNILAQVNAQQIELRSKLQLEESASADFWCQSCVLSMLPRKAPLNLFQ